jgi:hypothetical protein
MSILHWRLVTKKNERSIEKYSVFGRRTAMQEVFIDLLEWLMGWQLLDIHFQVTEEEVLRDLCFGWDDDKAWPVTLH